MGNVVDQVSHNAVPLAILLDAKKAIGDHVEVIVKVKVTGDSIEEVNGNTCTAFDKVFFALVQTPV